MPAKILKATAIKSCYLGPQISPEEFVCEHFFLFLVKGKIDAYDGSKHYSLQPGESCLVRKNHLARYNKQKDKGEFEKIIVIFDEIFLKEFLVKHKLKIKSFSSSSAFLKIKQTELLLSFLNTLQIDYRKEQMTGSVVDLKREELLLLILKSHPGYAAILFDFGKPGKIDLEAFINQNYKFNVSLERFAFLSGRSLSAFKRDFVDLFKQTPNRWLVQRRLEEARFLIEKKDQKPVDFYLDLGFEDLSHFSFAFKKQFGLAPTSVHQQK